ncbi:GroES-like protein [Meredithblackwellia eburnea MCA 4105]
MKAVYSSKTSSEIKDTPIPVPGSSEVLIKNVAVAANPKDFKIFEYMPDRPVAVEGNDVAGIVQAVGEGVTTFKIGDKVASFSIMGAGDQYGAYAEYTVSPASTTFLLGPKTTFEEASTLPLAYGTALIGLYNVLGLPTPDKPSTDKPATPILIWGASSTVGVFATQLAKKSGFYVVGIAGSGMEHARAYGADEVFDYRGSSDEELGSFISKAAGGRIKYAFDAVTSGTTLQTIARALDSNGGGKVTYVMRTSDEEIAKLPQSVSATFTYCGLLHGPEAEFGAKWYAKAAHWYSYPKALCPR